MNAVAGLGKKSRIKLAKLLRDTTGTITVEQAARSLNLPPEAAAKTLAAWAKQGWLSRVRRGLYVPVPLEARTGDVALEDPLIIADRLFAPCYIGGWSAAEYWDLTEQIFRSVLVMTTKKPRNRKPTIKGTTFVVRTILPESFFGTKPIWRGRVKVNVSDTSRTVLDLMDDPVMGGGLRPSADVLQNYLRSKSKDLKLLLSYAERLGSGAVFKRLGFLLERFASSEREAIEICRKKISKGNVKLDPSLPADRLVTAWRLWVSGRWAKEPRND
jgi:predicted transcriptional regulator of viral defense system